MRAVPWSSYLHDYWLLRLALSALDRDALSLQIGAIEQRLHARLARTTDLHEGADDLLYLVSGLGRLGLATDLASAEKSQKRTSRRAGSETIDIDRAAARPRHRRGRTGRTRSGAAAGPRAVGRREPGRAGQGATDHRFCDPTSFCNSRWLRACHVTSTPAQHRVRACVRCYGTGRDPPPSLYSACE